MARAANREAVSHLEQASAALGRLPESGETTELAIDIHIDLRNALLPLGERARMGEHLHKAEGLARALGDQRRLARVATFMVIQCLGGGEYDEAARFGREALSIGQALDDTLDHGRGDLFPGHGLHQRGELRDAVALLERNLTLEGDLRYERFGAPVSSRCSRERCSPMRCPSSAGSTRRSVTVMSRCKPSRRRTIR